MTNDSIFDTNMENIVQLVNDDELATENEAISSVLINPAVTWAKFILTDDMPNKNKQRIPESEFDNLIRTGTYMPIKMAYDKMADHNEAFPLGVITHLKKAGKQIKALAAFWSKERPKDIQYIKTALASKQPVNVSWEIQYEDSDIEEDGVQALKNTSLKGVVIVATPAYAGRTPILAIASDWSTAYLKDLPDGAFLYIKTETDGSVSRLFPYKDKDGKIIKEKIDEALASTSYEALPSDVKETITAKATEESQTVVDLQPENNTMEDNKVDELEILTKKVTELTEQLTAKDATIAELQAQLAELPVLKEFKASIDKKEAEASKLLEIKKVFNDAKIEKDESYFDTNKETLLSLDKAGLEFFVQELASFKDASASVEDKTKLPAFTSSLTKEPTMAELVEGLKARHSPKKETKKE